MQDGHGCTYIIDLVNYRSSPCFYLAKAIYKAVLRELIS